MLGAVLFCLACRGWKLSSTCGMLWGSGVVGLLCLLLCLFARCCHCMGSGTLRGLLLFHTNQSCPQAGSNEWPWGWLQGCLPCPVMVAAAFVRHSVPVRDAFTCSCDCCELGEPTHTLVQGRAELCSRWHCCFPCELLGSAFVGAGRVSRWMGVVGLLWETASEPRCAPDCLSPTGSEAAPFHVP